MVKFFQKLLLGFTAKGRKLRSIRKTFNTVVMAELEHRMMDINEHNVEVPDLNYIFEISNIMQEEVIAQAMKQLPMAAVRPDGSVGATGSKLPETQTQEKKRTFH